MTRTFASRVMASLRRRFHTPAEHPGLGRSRDELATDIRSTLVSPHVVYCRSDDYGITILRIIHSARDVDPGDVAGCGRPEPNLRKRLAFRHRVDAEGGEAGGQQQGARDGEEGAHPVDGGEPAAEKRAQAGAGHVGAGEQGEGSRSPAVSHAVCDHGVRGWGRRGGKGSE